MPEPNSTTAGIILGTGVSLTSTLMGAQVDALVVGLVAAIFVSIWLPSVDDRLKAASAVAMSALLAGYGAPVAAAWLASEQSGFQADSPLRLLLALLIGAAAPALVPVGIARLQCLIKGGASC